MYSPQCAIMTSNEYHIDIVGEDCLAPDLLAKATGLSLTQVKQAMQKGAVWLNEDKGTRRLRRAKKRLPIGARLHFYHNPDVLSLQTEEPVLLADEEDFSIWIKPRGVLSQGSKWGDHNSITRQVETSDKKQRPAFLIHRLDRAATGLMLIGHRKKITQLLTAMFARRSVQKFYQAIIIGQFNPSEKMITFDSDIDGRSAITHACLIKYDETSKQSLIELNIETGRKHQIRKHLSEAGFPIQGDRLYGGGSQIDLQLAAVWLAFQCPVSEVHREYQLPDQFRPVL